MAVDQPATDFNPNETDDPGDARVPANQNVLDASVSGNRPEPDGPSAGGLGAGEKIGGGGGAIGEQGSVSDTDPAGGANVGTGGAATAGGASGGGTAGTASTGAGAISDGS